MGDKTDHDMIIEIHTDMKYVREDIGELKERVKTQNGRIGILEQFRWRIGGALFLLVVGIPVLIKMFW